MKKTIQIEVSLDNVMFETEEKKLDITNEVFESIVEAIEITLKDKLSLEDAEFCNEILENYQQKLPEDFKNLKDMGFKIEIK